MAHQDRPDWGTPALAWTVLTALTKSLLRSGESEVSAAVHAPVVSMHCHGTARLLRAAMQGSPAQEAIADREEGPAAQAAAGEGATSSGSGRVVAVGSKRGPLAALQEEGEDKVTPELAVGTPVGRSKLFPVFRRRGDYKVSLLLWLR